MGPVVKFVGKVPPDAQLLAGFVRWMGPSVPITLRARKNLGRFGGHAVKKGQGYEVSFLSGDLRRSLVELAHEITHVLQFERGDLGYSPTHLVWKGRPYITNEDYKSISQQDHADLPWEQEAERAESTKPMEFIREMKRRAASNLVEQAFRAVAITTVRVNDDYLGDSIRDIVSSNPETMRAWDRNQNLHHYDKMVERYGEEKVGICEACFRGVLKSKAVNITNGHEDFFMGPTCWGKFKHEIAALGKTNATAKLRVDVVVEPDRDLMVLTLDGQVHRLAFYWDDQKAMERRIIKLVMDQGGSTSDWVRVLGLVSQARHRALHRPKGAAKRYTVEDLEQAFIKMFGHVNRYGRQAIDRWAGMTKDQLRDELQRGDMGAQRVEQFLAALPK